MQLAKYEVLELKEYDSAYTVDEDAFRGGPLSLSSSCLICLMWKVEVKREWIVDHGRNLFYKGGF